jgi:hypothetical protein
MMAYRYRPEDWLKPVREWSEDQLVHGWIRRLNDLMLEVSEAITALEMHGPYSPRFRERVEHVLSHCEEIRRLLEQTRPAETEIEHE